MSRTYRLRHLPRVRGAPLKVVEIRSATKRAWARAHVALWGCLCRTRRPGRLRFEGPLCPQMQHYKENGRFHLRLWHEQHLAERVWNAANPPDVGGWHPIMRPWSGAGTKKHWMFNQKHRASRRGCKRLAKEFVGRSVEEVEDDPCIWPIPKADWWELW